MFDALHVTNGDSTIPGLRETGLAREIIAWRDVLHEGPVPDVPAVELRRIRAAFLMGAGAADIGTAAEFARRDQALADHRDGQYVLWFEADLYDQLQLIQILATLRSLDVEPQRVTLICIGEHLGIAHFGGLGQLTSPQLAKLPGSSATTLTDASLAHATRAWDAFRAADAERLEAIASTPSQTLRFVAEAFDRLAREYPATRDGLSLTERRILAAVHSGCRTAGTAFQRTGAREPRPFLGDTWCFDAMRRMATAPTPLLAVESGDGGHIDQSAALTLTAAGVRALNGELDHVAVNGIDRWIGGVHLTGRRPPWRWHEGIEALVTVAE